MLKLLRLKGRTSEILFIDAIGRCSALTVCSVKAGIVSLTTTLYLITFCVHNELYILYISPSHLDLVHNLHTAALPSLLQQNIH